MPAVQGLGKPLAWLHGEVLSLPHSRPMPGVGVRCHELRIPDAGKTWRIVYRLDSDAVVVLAVFAKRTPATPSVVLGACRRRLRDYDRVTRGRMTS